MEWLKLSRYREDAFLYLIGRDWPLPNGRYLRPDVVIMLAGTEKVFFVGDAKRRKYLRKRDVEKVVRYRTTTNAADAAVFVSSDCKKAGTASAYAQAERIEILTIESA